jgi:hypothetical protein
MSHLEYIQRAVEQAAGCKAVHADTEAVVEVFRGQVMWEGTVEIFNLAGHPKSKRAYGWGPAMGRARNIPPFLKFRLSLPRIPP